MSRAKASTVSVETWFARLHDDENLIYLAARVQNYTDLTDARLDSLKHALAASDGKAVTDIARALTDSTARLGAVRVMRLCIALQMLGRRDLLEQAKSVTRELELELHRFKQTLISQA